MAVGHVRWRGHRCYKGPDWSHSDPLVEYGIGLPFGGPRSLTRPTNEFCWPRAGARIPQRLLEIVHWKLANVTNRGRENRYRDGQGSLRKHAPWCLQSPDRLPPWTLRTRGHAGQQSRV